MLFDREDCRTKSCDIVALLALDPARTFSKCALVEVCMTVGAARKCQYLARLLLLVTLRALKMCVQPQKRKSCPVVVELAVAHSSPAFRNVAARAIWTKPVCVRIRVAGVALGKFQAREFPV